ncbi:MAG TPA: DMT family transporter [Candidatus Thermoplasmatota archaeon]|nr:DMT family transporter [Candidatus Thermoplasmatota archaeon]
MAVPVGALLLLTVVIWGLAYTAIDQALLQVSPGELTFLRHVIATASLLPVLAAVGALRWPARTDAPRFFLLGVASTVAYPLALYSGQVVVPPGTAALLVASMPVWTLLLASALLGEALTRLKVLGVLTAMAGVTVIVGFGTPGQELTLVAVEHAALILVAPASWAVFTVAGKPLTARYSGVEIATWSTVAGTAILVAGLPAYAPNLAAATLSVSPSGWAWILFLGVFSSALTTILWFHALSRADASQVAVFVYLMPVVAILWAAALLGAPVTPLLAAGGALVLGGIAITNYGKAATARARGAVAYATNKVTR